MLSVGQDCCPARETLCSRQIDLCLQHIQVNLSLGVVQLLANALAAGFVALHIPTAVGCTI